MLLGGTEHKRHLKSLKNDLFYIAEQKGILAHAINLYSTIKTSYEFYIAQKETDLPEWYPISKAVQTLEDYVEPNYHLKR